MLPGNVVALRLKERPHQDTDHIASIYRSHDNAAADQIVARALAELALIMSGLADRIKAHEMGDLTRRLKRLHQMADNLGMITLSQVALDLGNCVQRSDSTAFAAVWARLMRIAQITLSDDVEKYDQSRP